MRAASPAPGAPRRPTTLLSRPTWRRRRPPPASALPLLRSASTSTARRNGGSAGSGRSDCRSSVRSDGVSACIGRVARGGEDRLRPLLGRAPALDADSRGTTRRGSRLPRPLDLGSLPPLDRRSGRVTLRLGSTRGDRGGYVASPG